MPTPFDQQVVLNPQQQAQLQALQAAAAAQPAQEPQAPLSIMVNKVGFSFGSLFSSPLFFFLWQAVHQG